MIGLLFSLMFTMISLMLQLTVWTVRLSIMMFRATLQLTAAASSASRH